MERKRSRWNLIRHVVATAAKGILLVAGLTALTLYASPLAASLGACFVIWLALIAVYRSRRRERAGIEVRLQAVRERYSAIIGALSAAMGLQDEMKAGNIRRVSDLTFVLAEEMGIHGEEVQLIQRAAVLADIGKAEIAKSILSKPGDLSAQEWDVMRKHPEFGAAVVMEVLGQPDAAKIVLGHHERYDGQGYPNGLRGDEIPMGARIYAVADAYLAMISDRPHRKKMSHEMALKEILRNSLTQFDPEVVRAFVRAEEQGLLINPHLGANPPQHGERRIVSEVA